MMGDLKKSRCLVVRRHKVGDETNEAIPDVGKSELDHLERWFSLDNNASKRKTNTAMIQK